MVYVLNQNGQPIMPTENHAKVRILLKTQKAKVVKRCPFTNKQKLSYRKESAGSRNTRCGMKPKTAFLPRLKLWVSYL